MAPPCGTCASCGKLAPFRCSRCHQAPEPDTGEINSIFYCSKARQSEQWPSHRIRCKARTHRKKLFRTAVLLKAAFLVYRALEFDIELSKIELRDNTLYLYDNQKDMDVPSKRGPFPEYLTTNSSHREATLSWSQCACAFSLVSGLIRKLIEDVPCQLEILAIYIGKPLITPQGVPGPDSQGRPFADYTPVSHHILKIRLPSNEAWILDITGAQYGLRDVLVPYRKYMSTYQCSITEDPFPYDFTETWDLDATPVTTDCQLEMLNAERPARRRFASFVKGINKDILDGSPKEFEDKLQVFKTNLKLHMSFGTLA